MHSRNMCIMKTDSPCSECVSAKAAKGTKTRRRKARETLCGMFRNQKIFYGKQKPKKPLYTGGFSAFFFLWEKYLTKTRKVLKKSQKDIDAAGIGDYNLPVFERKTRADECS